MSESPYFAPLELGPITLPNRIIMGPMTRNRCTEDGVLLDYVKTYYAQRATAGLIITEGVTVSALGNGYTRFPGLYTDEQKAAWREVASAVHEAGGLIFMQLMHTGRVAHETHLPEGAQPLAPSAIAAPNEIFTDAGPKPMPVPKAMTKDDIDAVKEEFAEAAKAAIALGFDGVELHGTAGYLLHQFIGANSNHRDDAYGGSAENRARFVLEVIDAVVAAIIPEQVGVKFSPGMDFNGVGDNNPREIYRHIIEHLNDKHLAYLHVDGAPTGDGAEPYNGVVDLRERYNGVFFAGGGYDKASGEDALFEGDADAVVFAQPFIANPDLPKRFELDAKLNEADPSGYYAGGKKGYIDYPTLERPSS